MSVNPYQSPSDQSPSQQEPSRVGTTVLIPVLCVLVTLHLLVAVASSLIGVFQQLPIALFGGLVSAGFYIAIFIGLLRRQEWARINLIWFCYVGIAVYLWQLQRAVWLIVPLIGLELVTLVLAHSRTIRDVTRDHSLAKTYTYVEED